VDVYTTDQIVGLWVSGLLTLFVFSFLFGDNPFYKLAEHIYVGVSAGYWMCLGYWQSIVPYVLEPLKRFEWIALIPLIMGIMLLFQLHPKTAWVSRWPLCFLVGLYAGLNIVYTMQAQILEQVYASINPLWSTAAVPLDSWELWTNWILVVGLFTGLIYFYFSVPHQGVFFGGAARIGIWILMIALGASFGYTVMARVSLLIGRVQFFSMDFWPMVDYLMTNGWPK
jgi:hypothetical protein